MQLLKLIEKKHQKSAQQRFEKWKFFYLGNREGYHVITQLKHFEMMYSDSDKRMTPVDSGAAAAAQRSNRQNNMPNDAYSQDSKSFYTDFSGASLPKTASAVALQATPSALGILNPKQI